MIGFVHVRDLLGPAWPGPAPVGRISRPVKFLPISKTVLSSLSEMRREQAHLAIVVDSYGGTAGIVTLDDLVEELIGDIRDEYDLEEEQATKLPAGEVEVDGLLNLDEFTEQTGIELPEAPTRPSRASCWPPSASCPPRAGVQVAGRTITVTQLDGRRIARLRVTPPPRPLRPPRSPPVPGPSGPPGAPAPAAPVPGPRPPRPPPVPRPRPAPVPLPAVLLARQSPSGDTVSAGQVRLDSEAPQEGGPR